MSVFQPVDVRAPNNRRKQLVNKLMQQQAAQAPCALRAALGERSRARCARWSHGRTPAGHPAQQRPRLDAEQARRAVSAAEVDSRLRPAHLGARPVRTGHYVARTKSPAIGGGTDLLRAAFQAIRWNVHPGNGSRCKGGATPDFNQPAGDPVYPNAAATTPSRHLHDPGGPTQAHPARRRDVLRPVLDAGWPRPRAGSADRALDDAAELPR
jgi:hypothetical protein